MFLIIYARVFFFARRLDRANSTDPVLMVLMNSKTGRRKRANARKPKENSKTGRRKRANARKPKEEGK